MASYKITYGNKSVIRYGETAQEAIEKYSNSLIFGHFPLFNLNGLNYDAETRGELWATYRAINGDNHVFVKAVKI